MSKVRVYSYFLEAAWSSVNSIHAELAKIPVQKISLLICGQHQLTLGHIKQKNWCLISVIFSMLMFSIIQCTVLDYLYVSMLYSASNLDVILLSVAAPWHTGSVHCWFTNVLLTFTFLRNDINFQVLSALQSKCTFNEQIFEFPPDSVTKTNFHHV